MPRRRPSRSQTDAAESLIDWREPERNADVLDWRRRAHEFGLRAAEDPDDAAEHSTEPPDRLLREEDAEAFDDQPIADAEGEDPYRDDGDRPVESGVSREELDLVRVYLSHVGKRRLLKAREEQELGRRIEDARGNVQSALAPLPCAVKTLTSLADRVRAGTAPAAELILLPDGGELKPENIDAILTSFERIRRHTWAVRHLLGGSLQFSLLCSHFATRKRFR